MTTLTLPSFAKINLDLRILGLRPDGYHDLRTVFQSLALADRVTVTRRKGPVIRPKAQERWRVQAARQSAPFRGRRSACLRLVGQGRTGSGSAVL